MHHLVRSLAMTALAAYCSVAPASAQADRVPRGKLPSWAVPLAYKLAFKVDPARQTFSGTTIIKVDLKQVSSYLWLDGRGLNVSKVTIMDAASRTHDGEYVTVALHEGVSRIDFGSTLQPQQLTLTIDYSAPFNQQLKGLYKVSHAGVPYAMTQMEPTSARFAFPGFDEPGFKTPYDISLTVPSDLAAVANTRQVSQTAAGDKWKTVTFAQTKPLPTYLVAFAVGPWDIVNGPVIAPGEYRNEVLPVRGIAVHGEGQRMQRALSETPGIIHALENYYGFGYPFGKLDLLAAPDLSAGAMENPGLVTFREQLLLLDADSAAKDMRHSFNVTAHELAHQWTGDTVTLAWWDDLWLNEAFATWMQQKVSMQLHPEYRADLDRISGAQGAMQNDSLVSARKIRQPITGNGDIEAAFDNMTYRKGASVLGMFEGYVGENIFRRGMGAYIQSHQFGNAVAADLVNAMAAATHQGESFKHAFNSFLDQPGVPYVQTKLEQKDGETILHLAQSRYLPMGSSGDAQRVWGIPICVRYGTAGGSRVDCKMLDQAIGTMVLAGASKPTWVMPNAYGRGYYRFGLTKSEWSELARHIGALSDTEQLAYADGVAAGFHHGDLDAGTALAALKPLAAARTREVVSAPLATVLWIYRHEATTDAQRAKVVAWVKDAYLPRMEQLGYQRKPGEAESDAILRGTLAHALALDYKLPEVRAALLRQGDAALARTSDGRLDLAAANVDLLGDALAVAVQVHGKPVVDALIGQLPQTTDPNLRYAMLAALSAADTPELADQARDFALTRQVKVGEMAAILRGGRDTAQARGALWHWFIDRYEQVLTRTGRTAGSILPRLAGGGGCSTAEAERLQAYFQPRLKELPGAGLDLAQTREQTLLCAALKARQDPAAILR
jgi:alanyl aminopeptidase